MLRKRKEGFPFLCVLYCILYVSKGTDNGNDFRAFGYEDWIAKVQERTIYGTMLFVCSFHCFWLLWIGVSHYY